ncbi:hypothetical protein E2C01_018705 [Portunus trituberculatus]|uniref:Uncharacterized protein n=1 Tax=Portunus trituberculatus TaxID=210409 RepID=A0A5B7DX27_PORTR|nr:hypothetical protein [Portunus trituberculatus]
MPMFIMSLAEVQACLKLSQIPFLQTMRNTSYFCSVLLVSDEQEYQQIESSHDTVTPLQKKHQHNFLGIGHRSNVQQDVLHTLLPLWAHILLQQFSHNRNQLQTVILKAYFILFGLDCLYCILIITSQQFLPHYFPKVHLISHWGW